MLDTDMCRSLACQINLTRYRTNVISNLRWIAVMPDHQYGIGCTSEVRKFLALGKLKYQKTS